MSIPVLQQAELDALNKVCSIGMTHAAQALSQLMGKGVSIEVPRLQILGNVRGNILILLQQENAHRILALLLGRHTAAGLPLSELEISTLMEVGNILASACLNAFGTTLKMPLLPSVPTLVKGEAGGVLARVLEHQEGEAIVMIDTIFSIADTLCGGSIFVMPESNSLGAILNALGGS